MYKVLYMDTLIENLQEIADYLDEIGPSLTDKILTEISERIKSLENMPLRFPRYIYNRDYRWTSVKSYMIFYKVFEDTKVVQVHRVLHGARDVQGLL